MQGQWLREAAVPRLQAVAEATGQGVPDVCPRVIIRHEEKSQPVQGRKLGHGTLGQILSDFAMLQEMGVPYVLLDTYTGNPEQTLYPERDWALLAMLANQVLDLENNTLR